MPWIDHEKHMDMLTASRERDVLAQRLKEATKQIVFWQESAVHYRERYLTMLRMHPVFMPATSDFFIKDWDLI